jgi:tyrosine-protein phosphatase YwqE
MAAVGGVDIHSHLVPGVDDGSRDVEDSLNMIQALIALGYRGAVTTPHIHLESYPANTATSLQVPFGQLQQTLAVKSVPFTLKLAAEYYFDDQFLSLIQQNELLAFGGRHVLFETAHQNRPLQLDQAIFDLQNRRYKPVFAHPERYMYVWDNPRLLHVLRDKGVLLQVNLNSILGVYNRKVQQTARYLLSKGMVDFLGTDAHQMHHLNMARKTLELAELSELVKRNRLLNATLLDD